MYVTGIIILSSIFICTQRTVIYRYVKRKVALAKESQAQEEEIKTKIRVLPRYVQHMHVPRPRTNIRTI